MTRRPLGVVDVVYASCGDGAARSRAAAADGYDHIDPMIDDDPASLALPVGCPTAFPKPVDVWCSTPAPVAAEGMWERAVRWWRRAPRALLEPWAGAVVNSTRVGRRLPAGSAGPAAARRHRPRRRLGRGSVRVARSRRPRPTPPGPARAHPGARRRSRRRGRLRGGARPAGRSSTTAAGSPSSTSTSPTTAGRSTTPPRGPATSPGMFAP